MILSHPPIVEAVVDIDCDLPSGFSLQATEPGARKAFATEYRTFRAQIVQEHQIEQQGGSTPKLSARRGIQSLQFLQEDEKQIVQVRAQGFSFNRLAPYSSLDDYLPEIEKTWRLYRELVGPVQVRVVRLRYINRIRLPRNAGDNFDLKAYLDVHPILRNQGEFTFVGFLHQNAAVEDATGNELNVVLATQPPEANHLPIIFDITVTKAGLAEPDDWTEIQERVESLRHLKNRVFRGTLTDKCLTLFQ